TVNDDAAGRMGPREEFSRRHRRRDTYWPLRAVLVAVKGAFRPAQRVVLDDDPERRRAGRACRFGDERRLEPGDADLNREVVLAQVVGELLDRSLLFESDFGMGREVVGKREELLFHQL